MAIVLGQEGDADAALSQINTTPLVDVMLVLLIIFLITIPVVTTSINVQLPKQRVEERQSRPDNIVLSVSSEGQVYWFDAPLANRQALLTRLKGLAQRQPQPEVHIRGDARAHYEAVGRILYACQRAGIAKVSFITEPTAKGS